MHVTILQEPSLNTPIICEAMLLEEQDQDIQIFFCFVKCHSSRGNFQSPHLTPSKASLYSGPRALHKRYSITSLASSGLHLLSSLCSCHATFLCCSSSAQAHSCLGALYLQFAVWVIFSVSERLLGHMPHYWWFLNCNHRCESFPWHP